MKILIPGGAGYIGSHAALSLIYMGHEPVLLDSFVASEKDVLSRLKKIAGKKVACVEADIRDTAKVSAALKEYRIDAVMHFAALKAVGESVKNPQLYFDNNVKGSESLFAAMEQAGVRTLVFSSSATVYGEPQHLPYRETHPLNPANPYGAGKVAVENRLRELAAKSWRVAILRYFNPIGAHESGLIGELPGRGDNLMPAVLRAAAGGAPLQIYGQDYSTPDGTAIRDYVHVMDLAEGHGAALNALDKNTLVTVNLGAGKGVSVKEVVDTFTRVTGMKVPSENKPRRAGDVAAYWADTTLAEKTLGWKATRGLEKMCEDAWRWAKNNPAGT